MLFQPHPVAPDGSTPAGALSLEARIFRPLVLLGIGVVLGLASYEHASATLKPWNRVLYPLLVLALALSWWLLGRGTARGDLHGRLLSVLAVNVNLVAAAFFSLFASGMQHNLLNVATNMFWLPLGYTLAYAALPSRIARWVTIAIMAAFTVPPALVIAAGLRPDWPPAMSTWLVNVLLAQVVYVPMLSGVAKMRARVGELQQHAGVMRTLALRDELTGLPNRRAALEDIAQRLAAARLNGSHCVAMLLDLDHFKAVNDQHGHAAGDAALREAARAMTHAVRSTDSVSRWGGEEFLVLAQTLDDHTAHELAERVRQAVAQAAYPHRGVLTASIGMAYCRHGERAEDLMARADAALYRAKSEGRDRVCVAAGDEPRAAVAARSGVPA